jgi:sigma-E factor negative regulatory protein RseC
MSHQPDLMEEGVVLAQAGPLATVRVQQGSCASSCGSGCICAADVQDKTLVVQAINRAAAGVGDRVRIAMTPGRVLGMAALAYLFPLVLLFAGAVAGPALFAALGLGLVGDPARAVAAMTGLALGLLALKVIFARVKPDGGFTPVVVEILS